MTSGGSRRGAGRRPADPILKRVTLGVMVKPTTKERLMDMAKEADTSVGKVIDHLVEKAKENF